MASYYTISTSAKVSDRIITTNGELYLPVRGANLPTYDGSYVVTPDWEEQTLETKDKVMSDDVTIQSIQLESVSNLSGGRTVYIGGII